MDQHSCAKGLQTDAQASADCERGHDWTINPGDAAAASLPPPRSPS